MKLNRELPENEAYLDCGKLGAIHGLRGEINFYCDDCLDGLIAPGDFVFLKIDRLFVPYEVETIRRRVDNEYLVKFVAVDSSEELEPMRGSEVAVNPSDYGERLADRLECDEVDEENFYADALIGFDVRDSHGNLLGRITGYEDSTINTLLTVDSPDGNEFYIPFVDEYIEEIDARDNVVTVVLPDGFHELI